MDCETRKANTGPDENVYQSLLRELECSSLASPTHVHPYHLYCAPGASKLLSRRWLLRHLELVLVVVVMKRRVCFSCSRSCSAATSGQRTPRANDGLLFFPLLFIDCVHFLFNPYPLLAKRSLVKTMAFNDDPVIESISRPSASISSSWWRLGSSLGSSGLKGLT